MNTRTSPATFLKNVSISFLPREAEVIFVYKAIEIHIRVATEGEKRYTLPG